MKAEMLQDITWHGLPPSELVIMPVARKLRPAVILISPEFWPSVLIWVTSMSLLASRVTVPPFPLFLSFVDLASMDPV